MAAESKPKSAGAPSFYQAAASMKPAGGDGGGKSAAPGTEPGAVGKKVENVKVLLQVFDKMDQLEDDQAGKDMIRQMSDLAKQYQQKLEGAGGGKPAAAATSDGAPGAGAPGGGGAGAGAPGSESMAVPA